jgi:hypothetical protein
VAVPVVCCRALRESKDGAACGGSLKGPRAAEGGVAAAALQSAHPCLQEVIGFKIPSLEVDKHPEKLFTHWYVCLCSVHYAQTQSASAHGNALAMHYCCRDPDNKVYSLQLPFKPPAAPGRPGMPAVPPPQQQLAPPPRF